MDSASKKVKTFRLYSFLSFTLSVICSQIIAQEKDEFAEEDAYFMSVGRFYRDIHPLIKKPFDWSYWETEYDSTYKLKEITKLKGEESINLRFIHGDPDEYDLMDFSPNEVHFLDYNADGNEDFIFQSMMGYRGHVTKFYRNYGGYYQLEKYVSGMVVDTDMAFRSQAMKFTIYEYPCCDGYVHHLKTYAPTSENDTAGYKLDKVISFMQSNLKRLKNLPMEFNMNKSFELNKESISLYHDMRPVYKKYSVEGVKPRDYKTFHPYAVYPQGAKGVALATKTEGQDTLVFARFENASPPSKHISGLDWGDRDVRKYQDRTSYEKIYLGWVNSQDVSYTGGDEVRTLWYELIRRGGCLTGGQNCLDGKCGNDTGIFNKSPKWQKFLQLPADHLVPFLTEKMKSTSGTKVHTCPFMQATEGEVAVYALQHALKVNWYDLAPEYSKLRKEEVSADENGQVWLERVLQDEESLNKLKVLFRKFHLSSR